MHSFNDQRVAQKLSKKGIGNVGHCMQFCDNHMVRIYPSGLKFDSRNFSPVLGWALGSQLVRKYGCLMYTFVISNFAL